MAPGQKTVQKNMKFSIKDFFSKCDQVRKKLRITFTEKILNGKLHFLCSARARSFWRNGQKLCFDIRVINTTANSQNHLSPTKIVKRHLKEKKRQYNNRVMSIEHCTSIPLVFSVSGSVGKEGSMFHKHMAQKIAKKTGERYEEVMSIIRCTLYFLFLQ